MRILLAEDETTISQLIRLVLVSGGHEVTGVRSAEDVVAQLSASTFDLVLLDRDLTYGEDRQIFEALKAHAVEHPPVFLVSGERSFSHEDDLANAVEGVLWKPFEIEELERVVNRFSA